MKKIIYLLAMLTLVACSNPGLNKSITRPLNDYELYINLKINPKFENFYDMISGYRFVMNSDQSTKVKYRDITYRDVIKYYNITLDRNNVDKKHAEKYPERDVLRAKAENELMRYLPVSPESILRIRLVDNRQYKIDNYLSDIYCSDMTFEMTALKNSIYSIHLYYLFSNDKEKTKFEDFSFDDHETTYVGSIYGRELIHTDNQTYGRISTEELKRDYKFFYELVDYEYDGIQWNRVPTPIRKSLTHWGDTSKEWEKDPFKKATVMDEIIEDVLEPKDYQTFESFYESELNEKRQKAFPLLHDFITTYGTLANIFGIFA